MGYKYTYTNTIYNIYLFIIVYHFIVSCLSILRFYKMFTKFWHFMYYTRGVQGVFGNIKRSAEVAVCQITRILWTYLVRNAAKVDSFVIIHNFVYNYYNSKQTFVVLS